jgi:hypothetical protein
VFGSKYFVLNETSNLSYFNCFNSKSIEEFFIGYFSTSKVYRVYILTVWVVVESVKFDKIINIGVEKCDFIVGDGAEDINTTREK